eukprot:tig00021017_g17191.t1
MAGITGAPFRSLCREFMLQGVAAEEEGTVPGLFVSEMIQAACLVGNDRGTWELARFGPSEAPRSVQIAGSDPAAMGEAARILVGEGRVDHVDINFGCPMPKITSKGAGSAIPARPDLFRSVLRAVVAGAGGSVPVTIKMRMGLDEDRLTFLEAGRIAQEEGVAAVALHARTAAQMYDGDARWEAIAELKEALSVPVLGNGDVWGAGDALRMAAATRCDGVVVGRGCLGRPWLFRDLAAAFEGRPRGRSRASGRPSPSPSTTPPARPPAGAVPAFRKHAGWYLARYGPAGAALREAALRAASLAELRALADPAAALYDPAAAPVAAPGRPPGAGKSAAGRRRPSVKLPEGFLPRPAAAPGPRP